LHVIATKKYISDIKKQSFLQYNCISAYYGYNRNAVEAAIKCIINA